MAAAIRARLPVSEPTGSMVVDVDGGTVAGDVGMIASPRPRWRFLSPRPEPIRDRRSAEGIKKEISSACMPEDDEGRLMEIRGRNLRNGVPKKIVISKRQISESLAEPVGSLTEELPGY
jgi:rod shape-determining protein MreB and related proteins